MRNNGNGKPRSEVVDRLPPHDQEAERAVLGCVLLDWQMVIPICVQKIGARQDFFYDLRHQTIYRIMVEMYDAQEAIDLVTLRSWLEFQNELESVGGLSYITKLTEAVPSAANITYYLDILSEKVGSRRLIRLCTTQVSRAYDNAAPSEDLISEAATEMLGLADAGAPTDEESSVHDLLPHALDQIETWQTSQGVLTGIGTGFSDLDKMTTGLHPGEMIVIAGRPSLGKTSIAMNIADHVAAELGLAVGVFSLEMTKSSLVVRMLCSRARVNVRNIQSGFLSERDMQRLTTSAARLHSSKIFINDQSGLSILGLRTRARRMKQQHGIRLLVIDYLQLMSADRNRNDSREQEVSAISKGVKRLAKDLEIPVIALSQLNRGIEKEKERRPRMSDLRESGSLEQDADFVGILWKPAREDDDADADAIPVNLEVCKQRNGPTGTVPLTFLRCFTRFESAAKVSAQDAAAEYEAAPQQEMPI